MIIVSITGPTMKSALAQVAASSRYADLFELRLDLIRRINLDQLFKKTRKPIIATCRPTWDGGEFSGSEEERISLLMKSVGLGARYVDIELNAGPAAIRRFKNRKNLQVIVSQHLWGSHPENLEGAYRSLKSAGADVIKIAYRAKDAADNRFAFEFLARAKGESVNAIAIAMGDAGEMSRVLFRKFGGWGTYAAADGASASAPGQLSAWDMKKVYRADQLNRSTRVFGVVGNPVRQSKGVYLHNPLFVRARQNSVYVRMPVHDVSSFAMKIIPFLSGFSVTLPHKKAIAKYLDVIDSSARSIGAINTVVRRKGKLIGSNSDASGALDAIERVMPVKGKHCLILGAGGAARALAYESIRRGGEVTIANRTESRARSLAREFGCGFIAMSRIKSIQCDILLNATSVGMFPNVNKSPVPTSVLKGKVVFDAVYNPRLTKLLRDASSVGARTISGVEMYINQAAIQSRLYTGKNPDRATMRRTLKKLLS